MFLGKVTAIYLSNHFAFHNIFPIFATLCISGKEEPLKQKE